jgi:hypothetical protein
LGLSAVSGIQKLETPRPDLWTGAAPYPQEVVRYAHVQCQGDNDTYYVFGGVTTGLLVDNTARRYDANLDTWTDLAPLPYFGEALSGACYNGKIYLTEGSSGTHFSIYDIASNTWSAGATLPRGVAQNSMAAWDGKVYLIGGDSDFTPTNGVSDQVNIYNIASNTWTGTGTPMPVGIAGAGFVQLGSQVYIVGGWSSSSPTNNSNLSQRYDILSNTWQSGATFTPAKADFPLAATSQYLYAMGGDQTGGGFFDSSNTVWRYNYNNWPGGAWEATNDNLTFAVQGHAGGFTTDSFTGGEVWSVGGLTTPGFILRSDNIYKAAEPPWPFTPYDVPWVSETPSSGTISSDAAANVSISINSLTYPLGTYTATLILKTNDAVHPRINIPVTMHIIMRNIFLPLLRK